LSSEEIEAVPAVGVAIRSEVREMVG
jgi:hypothetical protein